MVTEQLLEENSLWQLPFSMAVLIDVIKMCAE